MIRKCYVCEITIGECAPLDDKTVTHGLCHDHLIAEYKRFGLTPPEEKHDKNIEVDHPFPEMK